MSVGAVRSRRLEHRAEHPVRARQRAHRGDQLIAHPRDQEPPEPTLSVRDAERGVPRGRQLARGVDKPLQHLIDRQLRGDGQDRVADRPERGALALRHAQTYPILRRMPRHWIWLQVMLLVFILAGMVIAITKLA